MTAKLKSFTIAASILFSGSALAEIKVSGSDTLESYFHNALSQYARGPGTGVPSKSEFKGTSAGFKDLCEGRVSIAAASTKLEGDALAACRT